jgi:hypothetical protein
MKIATQQLDNLILVDNNTVTATIKGTETVLKFARVMDGWNVRLQVTVDGHQWHSDTATEAEKKAFDELCQEAWLVKDKAHSTQRTAAFKAVKAAVTI